MRAAASRCESDRPRGQTAGRGPCASRCCGRAAGRRSGFQRVIEQRGEICTRRLSTTWVTGSVAILIIVSIQQWLSDAVTVEPVPYSEFERYLKEGKIAEVLISDLEVTGRLKTPDPNSKPVIVATALTY